METPKKQVGNDRLKLQYLLPNDSQNMLIESKRILHCSNLGLLLTRYLPFEAIDNTTYQRLDKHGNAKDDGTWKGEWLAQTAEQINKHKDLKPLLDAFFTRWQSTTVNMERFAARSQGRLIIGLGGESVLETSLTLQFITGLPIIPGSALKGMCRHYALFVIAAQLDVPPITGQELKGYIKDKKATPLENLDKLMAAEDEQRKELLKKDEFKALHLSLNDLQNHELVQQFRAIFGSTENGGGCIFYDAVISALPSSGKLFEVDVMTPHFVKYYNNANTSGSPTVPPSDNDLPNPISFLTVAAGVEFAFAVGLRQKKDKDILLAQQASTWLQAALYEMGIGAKTASGYGVFEKKV